MYIYIYCEREALRPLAWRHRGRFGYNGGGGTAGTHTDRRTPTVERLQTLHVEYAERRKKYRILIMFGLLYDYRHLEYELIYAIYRVAQAEYGIHIRMAASQEYVNTYSTRRLQTGWQDLMGCSQGKTSGMVVVDAMEISESWLRFVGG